MTVGLEKHKISPTIAGIFAGASGVLVGHPFDTMKTRMQVGKPAKHLSFYTLYREYFKGLFFSTHMNLQTRSAESYLFDTFKSGGCAGAVLSIFTNPITVVKVQQQIATRQGMFTCASNLYKRYGMRVFFRGYVCGFTMEAFGRACYICTYEAVKLYLLDEEDRHITISNSGFVETSLRIKMLAAGPAGIVGWLSVYPIDLIKARLMLDCSRTSFPTLKSCIIATWNEGGIRRVYRGLGFSLLRAAPVAAMVLPVYETTRDTIDRMLN